MSNNLGQQKSEIKGSVTIYSEQSLILIVKPININISAFVELVVVKNPNPVATIISPGELIGRSKRDKKFAIKAVSILTYSIQSPGGS